MTAPVLNDGTATFTPGISSRVGSTSTFSHAGLKNTTAQSEGLAITGTKTYDAFGLDVSSTGTWKTAFGYAGNFGYQETDAGMKLLGHRYYDPETGRFLSRDPIKDGRNWYAYGAGITSSISSVDPTGLVAFTSLTDAILPYYWDETDFNLPPGWETLVDAAANYALEEVGMVIVNDPIRSGISLGVVCYGFKKLVQNNALFDLKQYNPEWKDLGNVNYGYMGTKLGIPANLLLPSAGAAQRRDGNWDSSFGEPWDGNSNGDDPVDQKAIRFGIAEAIKKGGKGR